MSKDTIDWYGFRAYPWNLPEHRPGNYLITNLLDDKKYIGVGGLTENADVYKRLRSHSKGQSPKKLKNALLKYGLSSFLIQPVFYSTEWDPIELLIVEAILIQDYDSIRWGYNVLEASLKGSDYYGKEFSEIQKLSHTTPEYITKIRAIMADPTIREKHREAIRAYQLRPDVLEANRQRALARWQTSEYRATRAAAFARPEVAAKRSAIFSSDEFRNKISVKATEMWSDPTMRELISESVRDAWSDPDLRQRQGVIVSKAQNTPEGKAIKSAAMKKSNSRPEVKDKIAKSISNLIWINNSQEGRRIPKGEELPEGWKIGRLTGWITNGTDNQMHVLSQPIPKGWRLGRLLPKRK